MKRFVYSGLIVLMLSLIAFPPVIRAAESTKTPFDYLNADEQAYVTGVRTWITVTKGRIDTARTDLETVFLQDYSTWYNSFLKEIGDINNGVAEIKKLKAPPDFSNIGQLCQGIPVMSVEGTGFAIDAAASSMSLGVIAGLAGALASRLDNQQQALDKIWGEINKQVDKVAKAVQQMEDIAAAWDLGSCGYRPASLINR